MYTGVERGGGTACGAYRLIVCKCRNEMIESSIPNIAAELRGVSSNADDIRKRKLKS